MVLNIFVNTCDPYQDIFIYIINILYCFPMLGLRPFSCARIISVDAETAANIWHEIIRNQRRFSAEGEICVSLLLWDFAFEMINNQFFVI